MPGDYALYFLFESFGDRTNVYKEKQTTSFEWKAKQM